MAGRAQAEAAGYAALFCTFRTLYLLDLPCKWSGQRRVFSFVIDDSEEWYDPAMPPWSKITNHFVSQSLMLTHVLPITQCIGITMHMTGVDVVWTYYYSVTRVG